MCALPLFLSVDPSLGRVDYSLLSDQTLMACFPKCPLGDMRTSEGGHEGNLKTENVFSEGVN